MRNKQWYWGLALTAALAVTMPAGAQQTQNHQQTQKEKQTEPGKAKPAPFNPCTGNGLPPTSQMAPFAPGSPSNINPPLPKTVKGKATCSNGKCKTESNSPYAQQKGANSNSGSSLPLSPAGKKAARNAAKDENAFPIAKSEAAQKEAAKETNAPQPSAAEANPFPQAKSEAAQAARQKAESEPPAQQGAYSSSNQRLPDVNALGNGPAVNDAEQTHPAFDPALGRRDDKVGNFYLQTGDWAGAYGRFKQAGQVNPGDLQAVIGLAIAADHLGKRAEAIRNYELYLNVMPNGKRSKEALKALKRLSREK